jgi:hypothetical protein
MTEKCAPLLEWFRHNGGTLNSALSFQFDNENGYHFTATENLQKGSNACICPFPLTLSHLNLLPTPPAGIPSFNQSSICSHFIGQLDHDVVAQFFLVEQRLKSKDSFWYQYIDALPKEDELTTPLYFKPSDMVWLYGTQIFNKNVPAERTAVGLRLAEWRKDYDNGISILKEKKIDVTGFCWEMYKWAATIFSSRSFTSQIYGEDSDDTYPILYPVLDCFNHRFGEKVFWSMGKMNSKSFSLDLAESIAKGEQVYNNYAPKGNEECEL